MYDCAVCVGGFGWVVSVSITNIYEPPLTVRDIVVTSVLVFKWTNTQLHKYTKYKYTVRLIHIIQIEDPMLQVLSLWWVHSIINNNTAIDCKDFYKNMDDEINKCMHARKLLKKKHMSHLLYVWLEALMNHTGCMTSIIFLA